jgi:hypothetical protein
MARSLTERLGPWSALADDEWPTLLVGNGLSINVWQGFSYQRLYDEAALDPAAMRVFSELRTSNFERVLEALWHTEIVTAALGRRTGSVRGAGFDTTRRTAHPT